MAGDSLGALGRLRSFNRYYHGATSSQPFADHFFTAFPGSENLSGYSLEISDNFYLYNTQVSGTVPVYRHYKATQMSSITAYFTSNGSLQVDGDGAAVIALGYGWNDRGMAGYALGTYCVAGQCFTQSGRRGGGTLYAWITPGFYQSSITNYQSYTAYSNWICFRDGHGSDCNCTVSINSIAQETLQVGDHWLSTGSSHSGYTNEGVVGYAWPSGGSNRTAMWEYYSPPPYARDHHLLNYNAGSVIGGSWNRIGIAFYAPTPVLGCTDSGATNHNNNADFNTSPNNCNYIIVGCMDSNANNYNPNANTPGTCTYDQPTVNLTSSPTQILTGSPTHGSATLSWNTTYAVTGTIAQIPYYVPSNQLGSGNKVVTPTSTTTYNLTVNGHGGTSASDTTTVTVYEPPVVNISADDNQSGIAINKGQSFKLKWWTTGDATSAVLNSGIGSVPLSSEGYYTPTVTTNYQITSTLTVPGTGINASSSDSITVTVYQPPTAVLHGPANRAYGLQVGLNWSVTYPVSVTLQKQYTNADGSVINQNVTLTGTSGTYNDTPYDGGGRAVAEVVQYTLFVQGQGSLSANAVHTTSIIIDEMANLITIPESREKGPEEEPVISPDITITSEKIEIEDVDIPVEVKASHPIKIECDEDGTWHDVRER